MRFPLPEMRVFLAVALTTALLEAPCVFSQAGAPPSVTATSGAPETVSPGATTPDTAAAWEVRFDAPIRWVKPTSLGMLMVSTEKRLYGIDGLTGTKLWEREVVVDSKATVEVLRTHMIILLDAKAAPGATGQSSGTGSAEGTPAGATANAGSRAMALDQYTGQEIWSSAASISEEPLLVLPVYSKRLLLLQTVKRLDLGKLAGGAAAEKAVNMIPFVGGLFGDKAKKAIVTPTGHAYMIDLLGGRKTWERSITDPDNVAYRCRAPFLLEKSKELVGLDLEKGSSSWNVDAKERLLEVGADSVVLGGEPTVAYSFDSLAKGNTSPLWSLKMPKQVGKVQSVVMKPTGLFVAGTKGFARIDAAKGTVLWDFRKEDSAPVSIQISPDERYALCASRSKNRVEGTLIRVDNGATVASTQLGEYSDKKEDPQPEWSWYGDNRIVFRGNGETRLFEVKEEKLTEAWKTASAKAPDYPEDRDARNTKKAIGIGTQVLGGVLAVGASNLSSNINTQLLLAFLGDIAVAAGSMMVDQANAGGAQDLADVGDTAARAASRFHKRQSALDPNRRLVVSAGTAGTYEIESVDLATGVKTKVTSIKTEGRLMVDEAFRLVYQRDYNKNDVLRAYSMPGYSKDMLN